MTAEDLIELLEERPFMPLRLHLADGRKREIRHPEMAIVTESLVVIGVPRDDESKLALHFTFCSIPYIVEAEPFEITGGNGQKRPRKGVDVRGKVAVAPSPQALPRTPPSAGISRTARRGAVRSI